MGRRERKIEKRKQIFMSSILVFLMIASGFAVMVGNTNSQLKYNGYRFRVQNNQYVTEIDGETIPFYSLPSEVEGINLSSTITNKLREAYLVMLSFKPEQSTSLQVIEVARFDLSQYLGKTVYNGVLEESQDYDLPVLTCENATVQTPIIILNESSNPGFIEEDNCIYLNANGYEFLWLRDRLLYSYHGVIED